MNHTDPLAMSISDTANAFTNGRRTATGFTEYPGELPQTLAQAYAVQNEAIRQWGEPVAGWKVGRIGVPLSSELGADRFIGPMFSSMIWTAENTTPFPIIPGGFAAFEAEFIVRLDRTLAPSDGKWTSENATDVIGALYIGVEVAGSPLATINTLGPLATIAGYGNNIGLIVGPEVPNWQNLSFSQLTCQTTIDDWMSETLPATTIPGGPLAGLAFALNQAARLGITLQAGELISTGAVTGVHVVKEGQICRADFGALGVVECQTVTAEA